MLVQIFKAMLQYIAPYICHSHTSQAALSKKLSLLRTDVCGQISKHIFSPKGGYCLICNSLHSTTCMSTLHQLQVLRFVYLFFVDRYDCCSFTWEHKRGKYFLYKWRCGGLMVGVLNSKPHSLGFALARLGAIALYFQKSQCLSLPSCMNGHCEI